MVVTGCEARESPVSKEGVKDVKLWYTETKNKEILRKGMEIGWEDLVAICRIGVSHSNENDRHQCINHRI
jgi:hypothetical protein